MTSTSSSNKSEHANQTGPYKREFPFVFRRSFWLNSISLISFMNPLHSVLSSIARGTCLCFILNGPFLCRILIIPYILTIIPKESTFCPIPPSFPLPHSPHLYKKIKGVENTHRTNQLIPSSTIS